MSDIHRFPKGPYSSKRVQEYRFQILAPNPKAPNTTKMVIGMALGAGDMSSGDVRAVAALFRSSPALYDILKRVQEFLQNGTPVHPDSQLGDEGVTLLAEITNALNIADGKENREKKL